MGCRGDQGVSTQGNNVAGARRGEERGGEGMEEGTVGPQRSLLHFFRTTGIFNPVDPQRNTLPPSHTATSSKPQGRAPRPAFADLVSAPALKMLVSPWPQTSNS